MKINLVSNEKFSVTKPNKGEVFVPDRETDSTLAVVEDIATAFSSADTYEVGEYVSYDGGLYKCVSAVSASGEWDPDYWTAFTVMNEANSSEQLQADWDQTDDSSPDFIKNKPNAYDNDPVIAGTAAAGSADEYARGDHVHPAETKVVTGSWSGDPFPIVFDFEDEHVIVNDFNGLSIAGESRPTVRYNGFGIFDIRSDGTITPWTQAENLSFRGYPVEDICSASYTRDETRLTSLEIYVVPKITVRGVEVVAKSDYIAGTTLVPVFSQTPTYSEWVFHDGVLEATCEEYSLDPTLYHFEMANEPMSPGSDIFEFALKDSSGEQWGSSIGVASASSDGLSMLLVGAPSFVTEIVPSGDAIATRERTDIGYQLGSQSDKLLAPNSHIYDTIVHITSAERNYWNNKANSTQLRYSFHPVTASISGTSASADVMDRSINSFEIASGVDNLSITIPALAYNGKARDFICNINVVGEAGPENVVFGTNQTIDLGSDVLTGMEQGQNVLLFTEISQDHWMISRYGSDGGDKANAASLAAPYESDHSSAYVVGDYVTHEGTLYKCKRHTSSPPGEWADNNWDAVTVTDVTDEKVSRSGDTTLSGRFQTIGSFRSVDDGGSELQNGFVGIWSDGVHPEIKAEFYDDRLIRKNGESEVAIKYPNAAGTIALQEGIAPVFSDSLTYDVGDYVTREGLLYKCATAVETSGSWTGDTNWTEVTVVDQIVDVVDPTTDGSGTGKAADANATGLALKLSPVYSEWTTVPAEYNGHPIVIVWIFDQNVWAPFANGEQIGIGYEDVGQMSQDWSADNAYIPIAATRSVTGYVLGEQTDKELAAASVIGDINSVLDAINGEEI